MYFQISAKAQPTVELPRPLPLLVEWSNCTVKQVAPAEGVEGAHGWADLDIIITADKRINREGAMQAFLLMTKLAFKHLLNGNQEIYTDYAATNNKKSTQKKLFIQMGTPFWR